MKKADEKEEETREQWKGTKRTDKFEEGRQWGAREQIKVRGEDNGKGKTERRNQSEDNEVSDITK